jgi:hypothetical protein
MAFQVFPNMAGAPFSFDNTMDSQSYCREDIQMDIGGFWDPNAIDPLLRNTGNPIGFYHEWDKPPQRLQNFLKEPQKVLFTTSNLPPFQAPSQQIDFSQPYKAIGTIPHTCEPSRRSPSSICSSATSPGTDNDWCPPRRSLDECSLSSTVSHMSQVLPELEWPSSNPPHYQIPITGHINLREVQGFPDPQEVTFQDDEGFMDGTIKIEYAMESDHQVIKQERSRGTYRHSSDEGIGQSLKSEASPEPKASTIVSDYAEADVDADGEIVDELEDDAHEMEQPIPEEEEDQDTDYKPKASRNKRRRSSRTTRVSPSSPASKRNKLTKSVPRSKSQFQCKACDHSAKDATALTKHVATAHTRPYLCTFSFAGCPSTFGNKNEWKRHVNSQHLGLKYWLCNVGACSQSKTASSRSSSSSSNSRSKSGGNEFNRKDLFTQHLRRMHTPLHVKKQQKQNADWEEKLKELQTSCLKTRRTPPTKTQCPVRACRQLFEGPTSWDDRMEHVGRHLEKASATANGATVNEIVEQESDEFMIAWALTERIIERRPSGGYKFHNHYGGANDEDGDADGEDE